MMATIPTLIPVVGTPPDYPVRAGTADKAAFLAQVAAADARFPIYNNELNAATAALNATAGATYNNALAACQCATVAQGLAVEAANSVNEAASYAQVAAATANFAGDWSSLSGSASVPLTVYYNGQFWVLLQDVSNISAHMPSDASTIWTRVQSVDIIRTPVLIAPLSGARGVSPAPLLEADGYANIYGFARDYREFQVDLSAGDFSSPIWSAQIDADTAVVGENLAFNAGHKWRCRDVAVDGTAGRWSSVAVFSTGAVSIAQPTLTVEGAPDDVPETPTLTSGPFTVIGGTDTHLNTDWQVLDDQLDVIWESMADAASKLSIAVPASILEELKTYTFRVRYRGVVYGASPWRTVMATTRESFTAMPEGFNDGRAIDGRDFQTMEAAGNYDPVTDTGFFGEVSATTLFTGPQISSAIGLTAGTAQYNNTGWLKFYVGPNAKCNRNDGIPYVLYIAKRPYRRNVSWSQINARGAVYWGAGATVQKAGCTLDVGLMFGAYADPANSGWDVPPLNTIESCAANHGDGSHWNDLIYRVMAEVPTCPGSITYHGGPQIGANWASYQNADLIIASGNGRDTWCQETSAINGRHRVKRGLEHLPELHWNVSSQVLFNQSFRPALRLS